jgi:L-threonylcarbamoyladenylate synthase
MTPGSWRLWPAVRVLRQGGIIAYPTEAVYGLGCDPWNEAAVRRILAIKGRRWTKGLILVGADPSQLLPLLAPLTPGQRERLLAAWPGPVTWLVPAARDVPPWLRGMHPTLAVRVSAHPVAAGLCRLFGRPIVSTSANRSGRAPARQAHVVRRMFGTGIDHIVHGPLGTLRRPTQVRDLLTDTVVRPGG